MKRTALLLAIGILGGVVAAWWLMQPRPDQDGPGRGGADPGTITAAMLDRAIEVVAIAENGKDYRSAIQGWTELLAIRPADRQLLLNQAVTVLKWINDTNGVLASGTVRDPEAVKVLEQQLAEANQEADRVLEALTKLPDQEQMDSTRVLLESELLVTRSRAVSEEEGVQLRKQAAERLMAALEQKPEQALLAARLLKLAEELQLDWPEVMAPATEAAYNAWRAQPRNLLLLIRAGQGLLEAKDKRLLEIVEASLELARPLMSMMKESDLKIAQLDTLVDSTRQVVQSGDWSKLPRVRPWFNVLGGTSAFRADVRLLSPDVMAFLDTSFLEAWRAQIGQSSASAVAVPAVEVQVTPLPDALAVVDNEARPLLGWYDYDVDRDFDLLTIQQTKLRLTRRDDSFKGVIEIELPWAPTGFCIGDFWTVDSPERPLAKSAEPAGAATNNAAGNAADNTAKDTAKDTASNTQPASTASRVDSNSHDTLQEILLWNEQQVMFVSPAADGSSLSMLPEVPGLSDLAGVQRVALVELDGDGDLDLVVATSSGLKVIQNNGNRTFVDITQFSSLPPADWMPSGMIAVDVDRDLDLDIVCTSRQSPHLALLENILHSQLRFRPLNEGHWLSSHELDGLAVLELDGNVSWDLALLGDQSLDAVLTRTDGPGQLTPKSRQSSALTRTREAYPAMDIGDLNSDGHVDICLAGPRGVTVFWNDGQRLSDTAVSLFEQPSSGLDIQDVDGDGRLELLTSVNGVVNMIRVVPQDQRHFLNARVRGINDNVGGRINHYAIGSTLEVWADGHYQARVVDSPLTHFGLPGAKAQDLRVIFNNGLTQNVIQPAADSLVQERQELKGSCPFVYGWDGERFQMITDLLWNAPLGLQVARGQALPDRRWENLLLPGRLVQPRDGCIELRVTEELWEVAYFDHVQLTAVDHPAGVDVWTNEKVGPPALAQPRLFTASRPIFPSAASDGYGTDCLSRLHLRDGQYVQAFRHQVCQGLCETHFLELVFDPQQLAGHHDLRLVLTGWMHPTDTSLNIGISQNADRKLPEPPSLWAPDSDGEFVCRQPFMGFPGGKPKTMVVDLNDVFAGDDTRLRIQSSQQIYWDQAYIVVNEPPVPIATQELTLQSAQLHYRGFGRLLPRANDQPHWYDYHDVSPAAKWPPLEGLFTRYGNVHKQMQADDDHIVVMASGDEMILKFALPTQPLPDGWVRDFVLHSVGWDKDADLNTLEGQSSLPLPFAAMKAYPPGLEDEPRAAQVWQLNADSLVPRNMYADFWHTK